jgi:hypothetical protein
MGYPAKPVLECIPELEVSWKQYIDSGWGLIEVDKYY